MLDSLPKATQPEHNRSVQFWCLHFSLLFQNASQNRSQKREQCWDQNLQACQPPRDREPAEAKRNKEQPKKNSENQKSGGSPKEEYFSKNEGGSQRQLWRSNTCPRSYRGRSRKARFWQTSVYLLPRLILSTLHNVQSPGKSLSEGLPAFGLACGHICGEMYK